MPPVPLLRPCEVVRAFERMGWDVARQRGSHIILTKRGSAVTLSIPDHNEVARRDVTCFDRKGRIDR